MPPNLNQNPITASGGTPQNAVASTPVYTPPPQAPISTPPPQKASDVPTPHSYLISIIVLAIILGLLAGYFYYTNRPNKSFTTEKVQITDGVKQLPAGFPTDIPVETKNISKSEVLAYPDRGATLYSVQYMSSKQTEELYSAYSKYLSTNGFTIVSQSKSASLIRYQAIKDREELNIIINPESGGTKIQLVYVTRK